MNAKHGINAEYMGAKKGKERRKSKNRRLSYLSSVNLLSTSSSLISSIAMASPSDPCNQDSVIRPPQKKKAPFKFLVPLVYAPLLPLIRISLRKNKVLSDRLFTAVLAGAFIHGGYLVTDLYDAESK